MSTTPRWIRRPEGANWGDFGSEDQLGRLNWLTPEKVHQGIAEVKEGKTFCLSLPLDFPGGSVLNPRRFAPRLAPTLRNGKPNLNFPLRLENPAHADIVSDDSVLLCTQYSTQWDSFAHIGQLFDADGDGKPEMVYYNGFRAGIDVIGPVDYRGEAEQPCAEPGGAHCLGIENFAVACLQGRAVMIDLLRAFGPGRTVVGGAAMRDAVQRQGITIERGDMVCLRTGFADVLLQMNREPDGAILDASGAVLDGRDPDLLQWISDSGLVALIADNYAVEGLPARPSTQPCHASLPLHEHCLFKLGIPLGELWHLSPLADWLNAHDRHRFLLTAPPLRLPGAVGSPVTPIATV